MKSFINVEDLGPLDKAMAEAFESAPGQEQDPDDDLL